MQSAKTAAVGLRNPQGYTHEVAGTYPDGRKWFISCRSKASAVKKLNERRRFYPDTDAEVRLSRYLASQGGA